MPRKAHATRKRSVRAISVHDETYLERSLDKFANAAVAFASTLASHTQRLDAHDLVSASMQTDLRELRKAQSNDSVYLNQRIDTVQRDLSEKLESGVTSLQNYFDTAASRLVVGQDKLVAGQEKASVRSDAVTDRIEKLENWRYIIVGGSAVVTLIVGEVLIRLLPIAEVFSKLFGRG